MYAFIYVCIYVCMLNVCVHVSMYVCTSYVCMHVMCVCMYACMYVLGMYVCMRVCVYVYSCTQMVICTWIAVIGIITTSETMPYLFDKTSINHRAVASICSYKHVINTSFIFYCFYSSISITYNTFHTKSYAFDSNR